MAIRSALILAAALAVAPVASQARLVRLTDIQPVLVAVAMTTPAALQGIPTTEPGWSSWIATRDREIRSRLAQGDEDTMLNWLLLGNSFTTQPPVVLDASAATDDQALRRMATLIGARLVDLLRAAASPGSDERRLFAREVLTARGFDPSTPAGMEAARMYLLAGIGRIIDEWTRLQRERSPQFVDRGLSLDTSLQPNYAIERTLAQMKADGVLAPRSVRRAAVIGAGLDFADKNTGFDFYPLQTVQPLALLDTLRRLDLAVAPGGVDVVALDISPRVISHVARAAAQAAQGRTYTIHLPLDPSRDWLPGMREYWKTFGDRIGSPTTPQRPLTTPPIEVRAVSVSAAAVQRLSALDLNAVTERRDDQAFDLVIVTNVFIYYDALEQALALANIGAMLRPAGLLLTNNPLPDLEALELRRAGSHDVVYTPDGVGDRIDWYRRK